MCCSSHWATLASTHKSTFFGKSTLGLAGSASCKRTRLSMLTEHVCVTGCAPECLHRAASAPM